jgi:hypothetical protein
MQAEFYDPEDEQQLAVVTALWDGVAVTITTEDAELQRTLVHAFRRSPVAVDDPPNRQAGTSGPTVLTPGDLEWFRAVARTRVPAETGLAARFVASQVIGGYDPAANYRRFDEQVERLDARTRP